MTTDRARIRLADRRMSLTDKVRWIQDGELVRAHITVGFDRNGRIREIFINGKKFQNQMKALIDDSMIAISRALQSGQTIDDLARAMGREGLDGHPDAASPIGHILQAAARIEREHGLDIQASYHLTGRAA